MAALVTIKTYIIEKWWPLRELGDSKPIGCCCVSTETNEPPIRNIIHT